jgi:hypothetical protein
MIQLPTVTVVAVTTKDYGKTIDALLKTLNHITPKEVLYFSDVPYEHPVIKHIQIQPFRSVDDYNHFIFKRLGDYVHEGHILVVQWDGYVIDGSAWTNEFLLYDYIGAPWNYTDGRNVGNGGFSLRSAKLHKILQLPEFELTSPEDEKICRYYRQTLEQYGILFAPDAVAHRFSFEMHRPWQKTFGRHNSFHPAYKEPVVLKREGAMGDLIMLEPVMAWFVDHGYRVILDTQRQYFNLFAKHYYDIEHIQDLYGREPVDTYRTINLDMAYEVQPLKLVLESYYQTCGITDGVLRNSKLNFRVPADKKEMRMFDKYVVFHTDDTAMAHRNVHGVDWDQVQMEIKLLGYDVFRVGRGNGRGGIKINTFSENMLAYIVANADYFIGLDSGCAHIAVASDVPSMIFFGSVLAEKRYPELSKIFLMEKSCPISKDGCYHSVVSTVGVDCEVTTPMVPCITWTTEEVIDAVKMFIV